MRVRIYEGKINFIADVLCVKAKLVRSDSKLRRQEIDGGFGAIFVSAKSVEIVALLQEGKD